MAAHASALSWTECYYEHRKTKSGGSMTSDVTRGYGPEMYLLQDAPDGTYRIRVKYFAANRNRTSTRTKVFATSLSDCEVEHVACEFDFNLVADEGVRRRGVVDRDVEASAPAP